MATKPLSDETLQATVDAYHEYGENKTHAAASVGVTRNTFSSRLDSALARGFLPGAREFEAAELPGEIASATELLERRKNEWQRNQRAAQARSLIPVKVNIDGPIGIAHFGDPHVDDPGTDIVALEKHVDTVNRTTGLFGANVGDLQNAWIGRLAHLYGEQSTSKAEAWVLTEWLVSSVNWLYLIGGNHDVWAGAGQGRGDPLEWMTRNQTGVYEAHGARLNLKFPNGKEIRVNARHDFSGHSMWNTAHGPAKAVQMGWRDHLLTCGHTHVSGYQVLKCPASGLISHALRVAGYKIYDRYAKERGLPNQNVAPAVVTIIDPQYDDNDPRLITVINDVEEAAEYLEWKRGRI